MEHYQDNNMSPENFAYWLQGFFEIQNPKTLSETQVQEIKNHLDLVFTKVTPSNPWNLPSTYCSQVISADAKQIYGEEIKHYAVTC